MREDIQIQKVEMDAEDGLLVTFSDGTIDGYIAEELLMLRPHREPIKELVDSNQPTTIVDTTALIKLKILIGYRLA